MKELIILAIQCVLSMVIFSIILHLYILPRIKNNNPLPVLSLLLIINSFRYLPFSLFMPGQVDSTFPEHIKLAIAVGDFISGILALMALLVLRKNLKAGITLSWIFSFVSVLDIISVLGVALYNKVYLLNLGANYFTVVVYVPMLIVIQFFILKILLNKTRDLWKI